MSTASVTSAPGSSFPAGADHRHHRHGGEGFGAAGPDRARRRRACRRGSAGRVPRLPHRQPLLRDRPADGHSPGSCSAACRRAGDGSRRSATTSTSTSRSAISMPGRPRRRSDAHVERAGVCRDFAHLAVTFCRCMNIPARYVTGYLGDIGVPSTRRRWISAPGSRPISAANGTPSTRATTSRASAGSSSRAAAMPSDVAISNSFGMTTLAGFKVRTEPVTV